MFLTYVPVSLNLTHTPHLMHKWNDMYESQNIVITLHLQYLYIHFSTFYERVECKEKTQP